MDQLYRGDIKPIVATEARIGGKIIVANLSYYTQFEFMMHILL